MPLFWSATIHRRFAAFGRFQRPQGGRKAAMNRRTPKGASAPKPEEPENAASPRTEKPGTLGVTLVAGRAKNKWAQEKNR
jgi:hypothetical protein